MIWSELRGRPQLLQLLQSAHRKELNHHAFLFCGPAGIGKKTAAGAFAAALNCTAHTQPCPGCLSCRKTAAGTHPDVRWIKPEGKTIKIDQMRSLKSSAYLKPHESYYQIGIISGADQLTPEAANCILKMLEEPPPNTVFILLAANPAALLPTVRSRCRQYLLPRLGLQALESILYDHGLKPDRTDVHYLCRLAEGNPGTLLSLAGGAGWNSYYEQALTVVGELGGDADISRIAASLSERDDLPLFLDIWILALRDILVKHATGQEEFIPAQEYKGRINQIAVKYSSGALLEAINAVMKLQKNLQSPVNPRLAMESALRRLKEVFSNANSRRDSL